MKRYLSAKAARFAVLLAAIFTALAVIAGPALAMTMPSPKGLHLVPGHPATTNLSALYADVGAVVVVLAMAVVFTVVSARREGRLVAVPDSVSGGQVVPLAPMDEDQPRRKAA
jgi:hypothetical protein